MSVITNRALAAAARRRLLRMHHESGVGHIGGNLSSLDCLLVLFHEFLDDNDRLILSKGHSAGALYIALWSCGKLDDASLSSFHQDSTLLPGHPPVRGHSDILFATGSLGHGFSLAAGTALAERLRSAAQDRPPSHVYCITSDGEWQEGSTWEGLIFAQHQKLENLTVLVDHNGLQGFGSTKQVASMGSLWEKLHGFDVHVSVIDGHNFEELRHACALRPGKPHIVCMNTIKGKGVSYMENRMEWHYLPIDRAQLDLAISELPE